MATPSNRFDKVQAPDPQAVTVTLRGYADASFGEVEGPSSDEGGAAPRLSLGRDGSLTAAQALAVACHLANEIGREVVVIDEGGVWQPAWGVLRQTG